jgi:hypothetical protein
MNQGPATFAAAIVAVLLVEAASAQAPAFKFSVRDAIAAIRADDCAKLGSMVNSEMDTNPAMQLVAGVIHEEGYCVDRSGERATALLRCSEGNG